MSQNTDAIMFYGLCETGKANDEIHATWVRTRLMPQDQKQEIQRKHQVILDDHCSESCPMGYLAVAEAHTATLDTDLLAETIALNCA